MPTSRIIALILLVLGLSVPTQAQSLGSPFATGMIQLFSNSSSGTPCASCKLYAYVAGTTTLLDTYQDAALTTVNANPIILNSAGRPAAMSGAGALVGVFLSDRVYKFVLQTSAGATIWTSDYTSVIAPPMTILTKTTNYTVSVLDGKDVLISCDASAGAVTIALYTAVGNAGRKITVKKIDTSTNGCILDASGTQTIDGALTTTLTSQYENIELVSDNANWLKTGPVDRSVVPGTCTCRLTLTSGTPVTSGDVTNANHIYLAPYRGARVALHNGTAWVNYTLTEVDLNLLTFTLASGSMYDLFLYASGATLTLERVVWTNTTTRATAITRQDGVYVKSGDTTRLYVGTAYATGANAVSDSVFQRTTSSYYNPQPRLMHYLPTQDSYTYSVATWRQANADTAAKLEFVVGVADEQRPASARYLAASHDSGGNGRSVAIGLDSITVPAGTSAGGRIGYAGAGSSVVIPMEGFLETTPGIGYHYFSAMELGNASAVTTWYGDNGTPTAHQNGIFGTVWN